MNTRSDMPAIEQELRDATHAYADQFEPASDAWARLRARADEVTPRRSRRWIFGIGGLAIATTAAALAIVLPGDSNEAIDVDLPTATQPTTSAPTTPFAVEGTEELYAFGFAEANASGLARFVRTGEPGADDEWTVELDATFWPEDEYMFSAGERIGLRLSPGEADPDETGQVEICSTDPPGADGRITCTATFPASVLQGAVPFGSDWAVGLVEAGRDDGRISNPVVAPVDADFVAHFTSGDAWGTSYFSREDDGETWTGWVVDAGFTNACWPPDAPAGGPSPCIDRAVLQVGLPPNEDSNGAYHMAEVCEIGPADDSVAWRCTGTFSGAAGDTWSPFGTGSVAVLEGDPIDTVTQVNVVPIVPCRPAATLLSRISEVRAFGGGCAAASH